MPAMGIAGDGQDGRGDGIRAADREDSRVQPPDGPSAPGGRPLTPWLPAALVMALLAITALCLRSKGPELDHWGASGPLASAPLPVAGGLLVALAVLTVWFNRRTALEPGAFGARADRGLRAVLVVATITLPLFLAVAGTHLSGRPPRDTPQPAPSGRPVPATGVPVGQRPATTQVDLGWLHVLLWALLGVLGLAVTALLLRYGRALLAALAGRQRRVVPVPATLADPDDGDALASAVEAGVEALAGQRDPRTAVIACYVAMEASLREAGVPRLAADSPEELLRRAAGQHVVAGSAAAELTELFREARFSTHQFTEQHRRDAHSALESLRRDLRTVADRAAEAWDAGVSAP